MLKGEKSKFYFLLVLSVFCFGFARAHACVCLRSLRLQVFWEQEGSDRGPKQSCVAETHIYYLTFHLPISRYAESNLEILSYSPQGFRPK